MWSDNTRNAKIKGGSNVDFCAQIQSEKLPHRIKEYVEVCGCPFSEYCFAGVLL